MLQSFRCRDLCGTRIPASNENCRGEGETQTTKRGWMSHSRFENMSIKTSRGWNLRRRKYVSHQNVCRGAEDSHAQGKVYHGHVTYSTKVLYTRSYTHQDEKYASQNLYVNRSYIVSNKQTSFKINKLRTVTFDCSCSIWVLCCGKIANLFSPLARTSSLLLLLLSTQIRTSHTSFFVSSSWVYGQRRLQKFRLLRR